MNKCIFSGYLVHNPERREVGETCVVNFTVHCTHTYVQKNGSVVKEPAFFDCEVWDSAATFISEKYKKGDWITVVGRAKTETWDDKEGKKRSKLKIRVEQFENPTKLERATN